MRSTSRSCESASSPARSGCQGSDVCLGLSPLFAQSNPQSRSCDLVNSRARSDCHGSDCGLGLSPIFAQSNSRGSIFRMSLILYLDYNVICLQLVFELSRRL